MNNKLIISAKKCVSEYDFKQNHRNIESMVRNDLRMQLAAHVANTTVEMLERENHVEFRMELIVATVDDFYAEVKRHAERSGSRSPVFLEVSNIWIDELKGGDV
jgi:hypothetical protein